MLAWRACRPSTLPPRTAAAPHARTWNAAICWRWPCPRPDAEHLFTSACEALFLTVSAVAPRSVRRRPARLDTTGAAPRSPRNAEQPAASGAPQRAMLRMSAPVAPAAGRLRHFCTARRAACSTRERPRAPARSALLRDCDALRLRTGAARSRACYHGADRRVPGTPARCSGTHAARTCLLASYRRRPCGGTSLTNPATFGVRGGRPREQASTASAARRAARVPGRRSASWWRWRSAAAC